MAHTQPVDVAGTRAGFPWRVIGISGQNNFLNLKYTSGSQQQPRLFGTEAVCHKKKRIMCVYFYYQAA